MNRALQRLSTALAASALIFAAVPATAGQLVDVAVISRATGQRIPVYVHQGRLYVPGTPGERYAVYVANRTGQRVMAVVSVDGVNVVTGETASPTRTATCSPPGQSFEINGWRKNMNEVASFYFTRLPDSYAARTDRPDHVGVIGVAAFREWQRPRPLPQPMTPPLSRRDATARGRVARASRHRGRRPRDLRAGGRRHPGGGSRPDSRAAGEDRHRARRARAVGGRVHELPARDRPSCRDPHPLLRHACEPGRARSHSRPDPAGRAEPVPGRAIRAGSEELERRGLVSRQRPGDVLAHER